MLARFEDAGVEFTPSTWAVAYADHVARCSGGVSNHAAHEWAAHGLSDICHDVKSALGVGVQILTDPSVLVSLPKGSDGWPADVGLFGYGGIRGNTVAIDTTIAPMHPRRVKLGSNDCFEGCRAPQNLEDDEGVRNAAGMLRFVPFAVSEFGSLAPHAEAFLVELAKASHTLTGQKIGQLLSAWRRRFSLLINMAHADNVLGGVASAPVKPSNRMRLAPLPYDARSAPSGDAPPPEAAPSKPRASEYPFWTVKLAQVVCMVFIVILTFSHAPLGLVDPESGFIIDPTSPAATAEGLLGDRPVVASSRLQMLCLAVSRMSAFSLYPVMILVFLSKCKATINFLEGTRASLYMWHDFHDLHIYCGKYIALDVWVHTLFHLIRWGAAGNISLLWTHSTGISGLVVVVATPLITLPMLYMKKTLRYEVRKVLHYLFYLFAVGLCFHVPASGVPNGGFLPYVLGACIVFYFLDVMYIEAFMTEKIETTTFHVLPSGVQMTMAVSDRFRGHVAKGGYAYVCLPWVSRNEWHAFSLFEDPVDSSRRQVFMQKSGDWSSAVHAALQRNTVRPVIVQGPFTSPYHLAMLYDNQVLVASGIGITPALSVIKAHKSSRRVNLIWAVRDPAMLEFFLEQFDLDNHAWNLIFYTGKEPINPALEELHTNVRIIKQRPNLFSVIPNIIYGIESKKGLPEEYLKMENPKMSAIKAELAEMASKSDQPPRAKLRRVINTWGIMYCGGSKPVQDALTSISSKYHINLNCESFAW
eukprot:jgi/Tetstr1/446634/TSEL_034157.t1